MPDPLPELANRSPGYQPRPLTGRTVLAVEDSRFASDALRLMCQASGARLRRADCLLSARRHLSVYRPSLVIIDMGLPDGSGAELIAELAALPGSPPVLAMSGDPDTRGAAMAAGGKTFLEKPIQGLAAFQSAILSTLPPEERPRVPLALDGTTEHALTPDPLALRDDLLGVSALLHDKSTEAGELRYAAKFLRGLSVSSGDAELGRGAQALERALSGTATGVAVATRRLSVLVSARLYRIGSRAFGT